MTIMKKDLTNKRIGMYLGITFVLTFAYEFCVVYPAYAKSGSINDPTVKLLVAVVMLVPALGTLLTRLITKEGFKNAWLKPKFKGHLRYYLFAWFAPGILTMLGMLIYFLIFPHEFDSTMPMLKQTLEASGQPLAGESLSTIMAIQIATAFLFAPLLNIVFCFGEEWGWRGYLLPKMMEKFPIVWVLIINGIIWGLWHAPITAIGHNYGTGYAGWPVTGIMAMCFFCIVMGVVFSYITIRTGSCLPASLAHGALNGIASIGIFFTVDGGNPFIGPSPMGIIGGIPSIIVAIVFAVLLIKDKSVQALTKDK